MTVTYLNLSANSQISITDLTRNPPKSFHLAFEQEKLACLPSSSPNGSGCIQDPEFGRMDFGMTQLNFSKPDAFRCDLVPDSLHSDLIHWQE
jgi:hypothetical protein